MSKQIIRMLSTIDIHRLMKSKREFVGVFSIDRLPRTILTRPASLIVNLDEAFKPGSHWVAIYLPKIGPAIYMDPFGSPPPPLIAAFLQRNSLRGWNYITTKIQGDMSVVIKHMFWHNFTPFYPHFTPTFRTAQSQSNKRGEGNAGESTISENNPGSGTILNCARPEHVLI